MRLSPEDLAYQKRKAARGDDIEGGWFVDLADDFEEAISRRFVAVICLNDYSHSVTKGYASREEAETAGAIEADRLQREADPSRFQHFHYHVHQQPE